MAGEMSEAQRANIRLDHINGDLKEIKEAVKENTVLITQNRVELSSFKAALRIYGLLILGAIATLIGVVINQGGP